MKNKEYLECVKCGNKKFTIQFRTYEEEENEEFHGEFLVPICNKCGKHAFAFSVGQELFKHVEKEYIKEELNIPTEKYIDIDDDE